MVQITFGCTGCDQVLVADEALAGSTIACPSCDMHVEVPAAQSDWRGKATDSAKKVASRMRSGVKTGTDELRSLDYAELIPRGNILNPDNLRNRTVQWVLVLGLTPLLMWQAYRTFSLTLPTAVWMIQIYFCSLWALYFFSEIKPERSIWKQALRYATFTTGIGLPLLLLIIQLPGVRDIYLQTRSGNFFGQAAGYVFGVGLFEELTKALPLIIFGLGRKQIKGPRDGLFLGLISGLAFAAAEGVSYTVAASSMAAASGAIFEQNLQLLFRIFSGPLLHGAMAGVVGWFVGIAASRSHSKWAPVAVGIAVMGTLHGFYDLFSGTIFGIGFAGLIIMMFLSYLHYTPNRTHRDDVEEIVIDVD